MLNICIFGKQKYIKIFNIGKNTLTPPEINNTVVVYHHLKKIWFNKFKNVIQPHIQLLVYSVYF